MKTVYFESGDIVEFFPTTTRAQRLAVIRRVCGIGSVRPRYRFSRPWVREEVRPSLRWW